MKKIVFLIDNLKGGGAEKAIKIIVEGLVQRKYKPIIILLENKKDYTLLEGIEVYTLSNSMTKYNFIFLFFKLLTLLKQLHADIVYATNTKAQVLLLLTKPFIELQRVINIQVDLTKQYENREYLFILFAKLLNFADSYSFISHGIYESLKLKIPQKKTVFIPNAIDFAEIDTKKIESIDEKYQYIFTKKVFVTIGRLTQQKGQWDLIEAFYHTKLDAHLVILGSGEKEQELKALVKKYSLEEKVFFLGFQSNPFKFLYNADIFVLSSLWEGFGNVIVEAMRCELPVISTDCKSGPREILAPDTDITLDTQRVEMAKFGILTPVANPIILAQALSEIYYNDDLAKNYRQRSIQRAKDYSKELIVEEFENYFIQSMK